MQKDNQEELLNLALSYYNEGSEQSYQKAFEFFQKSLNQGDVRANLYLGIMFERGLGVSKNPYKAKEYFVEAYNNAVRGASAYLGSFFLYGKACEKNYKQALDLFCEATRECDPFGDFYLGVMYEEGLFVKKSEKRAKICYENAGREGVLEAYYKLGAMYAQGRGVKRNQKKATEYLALSCGENNSENSRFSTINDEKEAREALDNIAKKEHDKKMHYEIGVDLYDKEQYEDALNFFLKGADLNCDKCFFYLGEIHEEGSGVVVNAKKAISYYKKAFQLGNFYASYRLGRIYENGEIVKQDHKKAMHYFYATYKSIDSKKIASYSLHSIATFYEFGYGVKQNLNKAIEKYLESLEVYWNEYSLFSLGNLYDHEGNYNQAIYYYECAGKLGYGYALLTLGKLYEEKLCQDTLAIEAYEQALEKDLDEENRKEVLFRLGNVHYRERNTAKSIEYFWKVAKKDCADAYCMLAKIYSDDSLEEYNWSFALECAEMAKKLGEKTHDIEKIFKQQEKIQKNKIDAQELFQIACAFLKSENYKKALAYFLDSFNMGNLDSCVNLGYMYDKGLGVEINFEKAKEYYEIASKSNHKVACYNLGLMYKKGRGVDRNLEMALKYFQISSKQGDYDSAYEIGKIYESQKKFQLAKDAYVISYRMGNRKALMRYERIKNRPNILDKFFSYFSKEER